MKPEPLFQPGQPVRFSEVGRARIQSMPEAWGLHRALLQAEVGEVVDFFPAEGDAPAQVSVDFPSGGAYNWDAECFELEPLLRRGSSEGRETF